MIDNDRSCAFDISNEYNFREGEQWLENVEAGVGMESFKFMDLNPCWWNYLTQIKSNEL